MFCGGRAFFCGILCVFSAVFGGRAIVFFFCEVCVGVFDVRFTRFAVFAFGGGRFFTIKVPTFGSAVLFDKRCPGLSEGWDFSIRQSLFFRIVIFY